MVLQNSEKMDTIKETERVIENLNEKMENKEAKFSGNFGRHTKPVSFVILMGPA